MDGHDVTRISSAPGKVGEGAFRRAELDGSVHDAVRAVQSANRVRLFGVRDGLDPGGFYQSRHLLSGIRYRVKHPELVRIKGMPDQLAHGKAGGRDLQELFAVDLR
mmetsp:Transcript_77503/g.116495  ORF Transcript_77503/g.116495 Transcript_77503/m.116495 type:complete len:106 (+) Transcript_77503:1035-1352(+)